MSGHLINHTDTRSDRRSVVVRDVRDRSGARLCILVARHDGTVSGITTAARQVTDRMYADCPDASNIESLIVATDDTGKPKWAISPNFSHLGEIGTDDAAYIWGDVTARTAENCRSSVLSEGDDTSH